MPKIDIAIAEDINNARARIARHLERLILGEPAWRVRQANSFNSSWLEDAIPSFYFVDASSGTAASIDSEGAGFIPTSHAGPPMFYLDPHERQLVKIL